MTNYGVPATPYQSLFYAYYKPYEDDEDYAAMLVEIDPDTIGQYTGLTDCNDKKIFEGDIVQTRTGEIYEFAFIERYSRFALNRLGTVFGWSNPKLCKVIGNIHDNPELLEAGE